MMETKKIAAIRWSYNNIPQLIKLELHFILSCLLSSCLLFPWPCFPLRGIYMYIYVCTLLPNCCTGPFSTYRIEKDVFSFIVVCVGIILNLADIKCFLCDLHETKICSSTFFEAEITHRIGANQLLECRYQEWERRLKVDAVGSQYNIWMGRYIIGKRLTPVQYCGRSNGR